MSEPTPHLHPVSETELDRRSREIDALLDDLEATAGPLTWLKVRRLAEALTDLYGSGLERLFTHARSMAADQAIFDGRVSDDALVAGLLSLHDLHPRDVGTRIACALTGLASSGPDRGAVIELVGLEQGKARLRLVGDAEDAVLRSLAGVATRAAEDAPPVVETIAVEGVPVLGSGLIALERLTRRERE